MVTDLWTFRPIPTNSMSIFVPLLVSTRLGDHSRLTVLTLKTKILGFVDENGCGAIWANLRLVHRSNPKFISWVDFQVYNSFGAFPHTLICDESVFFGLISGCYVVLRWVFWTVARQISLTCLDEVWRNPPCPTRLLTDRHSSFIWPRSHLGIDHFLKF